MSDALTAEIDPTAMGIIALVPEPWGDMWQVRHHLLSRVAQQCRVVWMNPAHHWRAIIRRKNHPSGVHDAIPSGARLYVRDAPAWLPRFHAQPTLDNLTLQMRLQAARRLLVKLGARHIVLYIWRPEFASALDLVRYDLSCYHIDDEYSFSETAREIPPDELALLTRADQVFIHSNTMLKAKGGINPHTTHMPNGVDYARYAATASEPADMAMIPRPRVGYTGWLKPQMDWPLLQTLVKRHSDWSFVFVGPQHSDPDVDNQILALQKAPNVYMLGPRPTAVLHAYVQHFDVCLMPYVFNRYTEFIYPVKVHEYLATGNPVVASRLPNLLEFSDVLMFANTPEEWSGAIASALGTRHDEGLRSARRDVALRHDWTSLAKQVVSIFEARLREGRRQ